MRRYQLAVNHKDSAEAPKFLAHTDRDTMGECIALAAVWSSQPFLKIRPRDFYLVIDHECRDWVALVETTDSGSVDVTYNPERVRVRRLSFDESDPLATLERLLADTPDDSSCEFMLESVDSPQES